jgi:DNA-binding LacI/PurR family transcriptional regulator
MTTFATIRRNASEEAQVPATIKDVAVEANTSISTVSRSFSAPESVHPNTRARVLAAAERLGYRPNIAARSLRGGVTGSVGVVIPDLANPFFPPVVKSLQQRLRRAGQTVLTADSAEREDEEREAIEALRVRVDGLVLWASVLPDEELRELAAKLPVVLVNRTVEGVASVQISLSPGMQQVAEHLKAYGHRRCAFVTCSQPGASRESAVRAELERAGLEVVVFGPYELLFESGVHAAPLVLAERATAVIAHNDLVALGLLQQYAALGVPVPTEVSVIGIDDTILASTASPGLSTVRIDPDDIAIATTGLLHDVMAGAPAGTAVISTRFIPRTSSGMNRSALADASSTLIKENK